MTDDSKTPEQMAEEHANIRCPEQGPEFIVWCMCRDDFLAGYQAAKDETNLPTSASWISVKERLPEIPDNRWMSDDVLWLTRYGEMEVSCLERLHSEFRVDWGDAGLLELDKFTHWMPLPEAPKEEK